MPRSTARRRRGAVALALLIGLTTSAACTGTRPSLATKKEVTTTALATTTTRPVTSVEVAEAVADSIEIFPDATASEPVRTITLAEATSAPDIPIVFLVKSRTEDRLEVYLPVEPNGSTGWVRTADVSVSTVPFRIEVSLSDHRIRVYNLDVVLIDEPISVGSVDRPTVGGVYYLKELLQPPTADGPYGTYTYGLSGSSTTLTSFTDGEGVVGIHGTNDPSSIGVDVSSGSIRLNDDVIKRLVDDIGLPLGTPVEILG